VSVAGAVTPHLFRISEGDDIAIAPQDLPTWTYVALGHIHKAQAISGQPNVRYAGSLDRLDAGEAEEEKSCVLLEIDRAGLIEEPTLLVLPATPLYTVEVTASEDVEGLEQDLVAQYPDHETALVRLRINYRAGEDNPYLTVSRLKSVFPRCYKMDLVADESAEPTIIPIERGDVMITVRRYLESRLDNDPARERLLALAADLVEEVSDVTAAH
jgi:DNA repair exonuclease SbcCD nuclease subunit